jgi:glutaminyl-peptide cyclotransferase
MRTTAWRRRARAWPAIALTIGGALLVARLAAPAAGGQSDPVQPERLRVQVLSTRPHDPTAYTQGLELYGRRLFESTGLYRQSSLREVDQHTGAVLRQKALADTLFGEGLTRVDDRLIQLTWREEIAPVYDLETFDEQELLGYRGEGWGLCYDGRRLIMSDGSTYLTYRDPDTFEPQGEVTVTRAGQPQGHLNELECVGDAVYANVWLTDEIVRIDAATGVVTAVIDASGLLTPAEAQQAQVLNGIAYDGQSGHFLITGKLWPKLFEVRFGPAKAGGRIYLPSLSRGQPD